MYLDTNGDGIHTDADVVQPTGVTSVDVWLQTNANRDGSPVTCPTGGELDAWSFEFILHAVDGTVRWVAFANNPPNGVLIGQNSDSTEFDTGVGTMAALAPGTHRIANLTVEVARGTPSLLILPTPTSLSESGETAFGTTCAGPQGDHTYLLGRDWFDVDGARYGGWMSPPTLAQPTGMTVREGATADQALAATGADGPVAFAKVSGPSYMSVVGDSSGPVPVWRIHLAPTYQDAGGAVGEIAAQDANGKDFRSVALHVLNVDRPPEFQLDSSLCVEQGQTRTLYVEASDPDYDPVTLTYAPAPDFVHIDQTFPSFLSITVAPSEGGATGTWTLSFTASAGGLSVTHDLVLEITKVGGCSGGAPLVARVTPNPLRSQGSLVFWTSKAGPLRVTLHDARGRLVQTMLDLPSAPAAHYDVPVRLGFRYYGPHLPSGVYFYRIEGADGTTTGRVVVLR